MIRFVTTAAHAYTVRSLREDFGAPLPPCQAFSYDELFSAEELAGGTYIFTDIERLSHDELLLATAYYRAIKNQPGFRVLNDPARVQTRFALLRSLREAGLNAFDAYRADGHPKPARFPVFIRAEGAHDPALTGLLEEQTALDRALAELPEKGHPLRGLVVIEYFAEPAAPGVFRRLGTFALGERVHLDHIVSEDNWNVKWGTRGLVSEEAYLEDDVAVRENRYETVLRRAFEIAGIEYGRADFGLVGGRPQIYEINTNPFIGRLEPHSSPTRMATMRFAHERFAEYLQLLDMPSNGGVLRIDRTAFGREAQRAQAEFSERRAAAGSSQTASKEAALATRSAAETKRLRAENEALRQALAVTRASTSWRATAPLRLAVAKIKPAASWGAPAPQLRSVGICMLRDSIDLVPFLCGHYLRMGLDRIEFIDDGSSDGSLQLLHRLSRREPRICVRSVKNKALRQADEVNDTVHTAIEDGFRLILPFDADEFWDIDPETFRAILANPKPRLLRGRWVNFAQRRTVEASRRGSLFAMRYRAHQLLDHGTPEIRSFREPFISSLQYKVAGVAGEGPLTFRSGQHAVEAGPEVFDSRPLEVFHLPLRTKSELIKRALNYEPRRAAVRQLPDESWQSKFHAEIVRDGLVDKVWAANSIDTNGRLDVYGELRPAIRDSRLSRRLAAASAYMLRRFGMFVV